MWQADVELQAKQEEENPKLSENNVLSSGSIEESAILKPTVSSAEQSFFSEDILEFLDNECSKPNVPTVLDLSQGKFLGDNVTILDLTKDTRTGIESYPSDKDDFILDLTQTMEEHKESNGTRTQSRKHKLHVVSECEGSASKSVKIRPHSPMPRPISTNHFNKLGKFPHLNFAGSNDITKNHTVTSADVSGNASITWEPRTNGVRLETHLEPYNSPTTIDLPTYSELYPTKGPSLRTNSPSSNWPTTPQIGVGLGLSNDSAFPQTKDNAVCSRLISENIDYSTQAQPMTTTGLNDTHNPVNARDILTLYNQLLGMFPDIEENFLRNILIGKDDLNQVIDIILEMNNNYPKVGRSKQTLQNNPEPFINTVKPINMPQSLDKTTPSSNQRKLSLHSYLAPFLGNTEAIPINRRNEEVYVVSEHNKVTESEGRPILQNCLSKCDHTETSEVPFDIPLPVSGLSSHCSDMPGTEQNDDMQKFDFLVKIFPDADPAFLQTKCKLGESDLRNVVSEALENNNYPKIVIKEEKKVEDNDQSDLELYTTSFDVEKFLKIFPEPFQYFFDEKICHYKQHCLEFMKRR